MKILSSKLGLIAAAGLMAATLTTTARAQDNNLFRVHVPFNFLAGNQVMPAGDYTVRYDPRFNLVDILPTPGRGIHRVMLHAKFTKRPGNNSEGGLLTFAKYGDKFVLRGIWSDGASEGHEAIASKAEIELARGSGAMAPAETETGVEIR